MFTNYNSLTGKQKKVYKTIETYLREKGIPPTVREIGEIIGEKTPGAVQGILNRLESKGVIKRQAGAARSIQLVSEDSLYENPLYLPEIKKISVRNYDDLLNIYNIIRYIPFSPSILNADKNTKGFIIKCPDLSMEESGITYNDLLIVLPKVSISDGSLVLVLYDSRVVLRKYYSNTAETCTLKADTNLLSKEIFTLEEIKIIGRIAGKITTY